MGERADVLFDTGMQTNGTHEANGVAWYFGYDFSIGFARAGDNVSLGTCDLTEDNPEYRLCWHTTDGDMLLGWRCGALSMLDGDEIDSWEKVIYQAD